MAHLLSQKGAYIILSGGDPLKLKTIANECARAYLIEEVRTCRRTQTGIDESIVRGSSVNNPRALVLELDDVEKAIEWRGRVDVLFNNDGEYMIMKYSFDLFSSSLFSSSTDTSEFAILPDSSVDENTFVLNCLSPIHITKALIPYAFQPLESPTPPKPKMAFPNFQKLESRDLKSVARSVGGLVRSVSAVGLERGTDVVSKMTFARKLRRLIWGDAIEYTRTFNIVNISSVAARVNMPGRAAYSAAKSAFMMYCDVLKMEARGLAQEGKHKSKIAITNCLQVGTPLLQKDASSGMKGGVPTGKAIWNTGTQISPARSAELILRATVNQLSECWILPQPDITYTYASYYTPWLWKYYSARFLELPAHDAVVNYKEQMSKDLSGATSSKKTN